MKKEIKQILVFVSAISIFIFSSCSRERIDGLDELNAYAPISKYLDTKKQSEQEFEVTEESENPIIGNQGTNIWVSKDLLMFPDSSDVDWPFTVKLVELYTAKDMIYYQMPTVAGNDILETEGEVRVRAFKADASGEMQELLLKPNRTFSVEMPSDSARENLKVYYGKEVSGFTDWTTDVISIGGNTGDVYFTKTTNGHKANVGKLGWINCGTNHQGVYSLKFVSETDQLENVGLFVYIPKYKTLIQAYTDIAKDIPENSDVKIIAMGINAKGELFNQFTITSITATNTMSVVLQPISESELTSILDNL